MKPGQIHTCVFFDQVIRWGGDWQNPLFVHRDVCTALGISKHRDAYDGLEDYHKGGPLLVDSLGGPQEMVTLTEAGLFTLILRSRKPAAKAFEKWLVTEVLPSIRRTGGYGRPELSLEDLARHPSFLPMGAGYGKLALLPRASGEPVPDLATEHMQKLLTLTIGDDAGEWSGRIGDLVTVCLREHLFWWVIREADSWPQRTHLGRILALRAGINYLGFAGTHLQLRTIGRARHRKYAIIRLEGGAV